MRLVAGAALALAALAATTACRPHVDVRATVPSVPLVEGLALAVYLDDGVTADVLVDDRRWITIAPGQLLALDDVDAKVSSAAITIESLSDPTAFALGPCERAGAVLQCHVAARPGRQLIRIAYTLRRIEGGPDHVIAMTSAARATVTTSVLLGLPALHRTAAVTIFDALPTGPRTPLAIAHATVALDGADVVIAAAPYEVDARIVRIYRVPDDSSGLAYDIDALPSDGVWAWLELPGVALAHGSVHVHATLGDDGTHDIVWPSLRPTFDGGVGDAAGRRGSVDAAPGRTLIPLWMDDTLHPQRTRTFALGGQDAAARSTVHMHLDVAIANAGPRARTVWLEVPLPPAEHQVVELSTAGQPWWRGDLLINRLAIAPGATATARYVVSYTGSSSDESRW